MITSRHIPNRSKCSTCITFTHLGQCLLHTNFHMLLTLYFGISETKNCTFTWQYLTATNYTSTGSTLGTTTTALYDILLQKILRNLFLFPDFNFVTILYLTLSHVKSLEHIIIIIIIIIIKIHVSDYRLRRKVQTRCFGSQRLSRTGYLNALYSAYGTSMELELSSVYLTIATFNRNT